MSNNKLIKEAVLDLQKQESIKDDNDINYKPKDEHEAAYSQILNAYSTNIQTTLRSKHSYKKCFFCISVSILVLTFGLFFITPIFFARGWIPENTLNNIPLVVSSTLSFLTIFIVIPKIITNYLFNLEEEKYMYQIIKSIQDYDKK